MECLIYKTVRCTISISEKKIQAIVSSVLRMTREKPKSVSIHLIGDTKMKQLNSQFRRKNSTTDVLSFAIQEGEHFFDSDELGEIFISIPRIKKQAKQNKISFQEEFMRMLIHGMLHLLGYDHAKPKAAKKMFLLQEKILKENI
ncbi:MAG: rRNA maturation RNase YbeY [Candidatus Magasanikbacteria bacterium]